MDLEQLLSEFENRIIFACTAGSHAYGTATEQSDEDVRGVFITPSTEYLSLEAPPAQVSDDRNDIVYYSLRRFLELAAEANPTVLELLFMPEDCVNTQTPVMDRLLECRDMFVSSRCLQSHTGYALAQIRRAKGRNKWVNNPQPQDMPGKEDFCWVLLSDDGADGLPMRPVSLGEAGIDLSEYHVSSLEHCHDLYRLYHYGASAKGVFRGDLLVCESIPKDDESSRCRGLLIFNKTGWQQAVRDHKHYWEWRGNRNDARWQDQESGEIDYDAKNMMHTFRLLLSGKCILENGYPRVRFDGDDRQFLLDIRAGVFSYEELIRRSEALVSELQGLADRTSIPAKPATRQVNALLHELTEMWKEKYGQ